MADRPLRTVLLVGFRLACMAFLTTTAIVLIAAHARASSLDDHLAHGNACFARSYSTGHLAKHTGQRVAEIRFDSIKISDAGPVGSDIEFRITVRYRNSDRYHSNVGVCFPVDSRYRCQLECDGGRFFLKGRDNKSLLLQNDRGFVITDCGGNDYAVLEPEPDDKFFRLDRLAGHLCTP